MIGDLFAVLTGATFVASAISFSVVLLLGTLGELLAERVGHLNLGVEGMMLMGAAIGYMTVVFTENLALALLLACLGSGLGALMYAFLTVTLRVNQIVAGLALSMFGAGLANSIGSKVADTTMPVAVQELVKHRPFQLSDVSSPFLDYVNKVFLSHNLFVYGAIFLAIIITVFLFKTKEGLALRMTGENTAAADASGIKVNRIKYTYIVLGGMLCGLGGVYLPLVFHGRWTDNITAGQGWLVVALVIFVRWHPMKAIIGAYIFGALTILGFSIQLNERLSAVPIFNQYIMSMFPYLLTIIVLVISSLQKKAWRGPREIGHAYFREDR